MAIDMQTREALAVRHKIDPKQVTSTQARALLARERIPDFCRKLVGNLDAGGVLTERDVMLLYNEYRQYFSGKRPFRCSPDLVSAVHGWNQEAALSYLLYLSEPTNVNRRKVHEMLVELCAMSCRS